MPARRHSPAARDAALPAAPEQAEGRSLFETYGCGACHAVRGTPAQGSIDPDLTHVGSRRTIGAGTLPAAAEAFAQWIRDSHRIKPENRMLPYGIIGEAEAGTMARYLEGLQ